MPRRLGVMASRRRTGVLVVSGLAGLLIATVLSLMIGAEPVPPAAVWEAVRGGADEATRALVWQYRLPRTLVALCVGVALGVAGMLMQAFTRNPLADPGILGVNAGAALAVVVCIFVFQLRTTSDFIVPALVGALFATLLVVLIGSSGRGPATPLRLTLAGVALAAVLGGITAAIRLADPLTFDRMRVWSAGSVAGRSLDDLQTLLPWLVLGVLIAAAVARPLNAIALGEDLASTLGATVRTTRTFAIAAVTILAGAATAIAGPIAFIGLMVPHICRWAVGPDQRRIFATTLVIAPLLLLVSDLLSRVVLGQRELPVGIVTAFVGAPMLIALVRRKKVSAL